MTTPVLWFMCSVICVVCSALEGIQRVPVNDGDDFTELERNPYLAALRERPWTSEQGYVQVRRGAFLFWWLYYADGTRKGASGKPLLVWIQGGPGFAASGLANFAELGPLTMKMRPRNHTWVKGRNVLLIDHPVGSGFSYAANDDISLYATTDRRVAMDLMYAIRGFLKAHPQFQQSAAYITSQSYGGKIAPRLGYILHKATVSGFIKMNLKAVGIGSGWVDPREISLVQPSYMYHTGLIDYNAYTKTTKQTKEMALQISRMNMRNASAMDTEIFGAYNDHNVIDNFMNVAKADAYPDLSRLAEDINKFVKPTLAVVNQSRTWAYESDLVFQKLSRNVMLPATKFVEKLLNETDIKVVVYNGNMDAVCPMAGAVNWVHKLNWAGAKEFKNKVRIKMEGKLNGFYKAAGRLSLWWVLRAGHWVPEDNPEAMEQILKYMTGDSS